MDDERAQRAEAFGQVAELFGRWRPDYPDALYPDVLDLPTEARLHLRHVPDGGRYRVDDLNQ